MRIARTGPGVQHSSQTISLQLSGITARFAMMDGEEEILARIVRDNAH